MHWNFLAFLSLIFLAVLMLLLGVFQFWNTLWGAKASIIKRRLRAITGELSLENQTLVKARYLSKTPWVHKALMHIPHIQSWDVFLTQAGLVMSVGRFLMYQVLAACVGVGLVWVFDEGLAWALQCGVLPSLTWLFYLQQKRLQRVAQMEAQLPDTLDLMARAMQAGHAFSSALLIVGSDGTQPIRGEFQSTFDEINFGISTATALQHLTMRVASNDLRFFVVAVLIQLETGGNLTDILKSLAALIRDRQRIAGSVRVLSAEGRLSAWILGLLPFCIAALLSIINPEFISVLWTDPMGVMMLQVSLGLMLVGVWWMWRMVRIDI